MFAATGHDVLYSECSCPPPPRVRFGMLAGKRNGPDRGELLPPLTCLRVHISIVRGERAAAADKSIFQRWEEEEVKIGIGADDEEADTLSA